jgi:hypothetical protein
MSSPERALQAEIRVLRRDAQRGRNKDFKLTAPQVARLIFANCAYCGRSSFDKDARRRPVAKYDRPSRRQQGLHTEQLRNGLLALQPYEVALARAGILGSCPPHRAPSAGGASMNWKKRIENYGRETKFPRSLFVGEDGRVVGTWIMGQSYKVLSGYYGGFPAGYLKRVKALFPEKKNVLHLFSGRVDTQTFPGKTVDINPATEPDFVDDAQTLVRVPLAEFDLVLADPPYSVEDAEHYQTTMVKRNVVMSALGARLPVGAHVVWLDQVLPMYRKDQFRIEAVIGMVKSTNHRFRVVTIFGRV